MLLAMFVCSTAFWNDTLDDELGITSGLKLERSSGVGSANLSCLGVHSKATVALAGLAASVTSVDLCGCGRGGVGSSVNMTRHCKHLKLPLNTLSRQTQ